MMVRIIGLSPIANRDLSEQLAKRKDVIHKISIRSNMQNPIKRWNLVSNDEFQNELTRYFLSKKKYYERREFEWRHRKLELSSVGITRGSDIRWMTQLIAAYYYDRKKLGPAIAQAQLKTLFEEEPYSVIRNTPPAKIYQLYLMGEIVEWYLKRLRGKRKYIDNVYRYIEFSVFAVICKVIRELNIRLGSETYEQHLNEEYERGSRQWEQLIKQIIDHILVYYKRASVATWQKDRKKLTHANYFKNQTMIKGVMRAKVPKKIVNSARSLLVPD